MFQVQAVNEKFHSGGLRKVALFAAQYVGLALLFFFFANEWL